MELLKIWNALLRRKWIFIQAVVFFTAGAITLAMVMPRHYVSASKISVSSSSTALSILGDMGLGEMASALNSSSNDIETKMSLSQMRPVLSEIVWRLQLRDIYGKLLQPEKLLAPGIDGTIEAMPMLSITQAQGTDILIISADANTPELSALLADTGVEVFLKLSVDYAKGDTEQALTFVKAQLGQLDEQYTSSLQDLAEGQAKEHVIELDSETKGAVGRVNELINELNTVDAQIRDNTAQLHERGQQNLLESPDLVAPSSEASNSTLRSLRDKLTELRLSKNAAMLDKTEDHPDIIADNKQIAAVQHEIEVSQKESHDLDPQMETLQVQLSGERQRRDEIAARLNETIENGAALPKKAQQLAKLQLRVSATQSVYESLMEEQYQIAVAEALTVSDMKSVELAKQPDKPDSPKVLVYTILGAFVGVCAGAALVFLLEYVDDSIRSQEDIKIAWSLPVLGFIPKYKLKTGRFIDSVPPTDPLAEAYRAVRSGIAFAGVDQQINVLTVTSSIPGEGKSTFCTNLAICLAADGKRVIVVDCDLRRPTQHKNFPSLTNQFGVSTVLAGTSTLADSIQGTSVPNFSVLTSGALPSNPGRLVESLKLRTMFAELGRTFDMVIVDAPPMLAVSDAVALSRASKGVVMVVEAGKTTRRMLSDVKLRMDGAGVEPIGFVLNKVDPRSGTYGYYKKYAQHYTKQATNESAEPRQAGEAS